MIKLAAMMINSIEEMFELDTTKYDKAFLISSNPVEIYNWNGETWVKQPSASKDLTNE